MPTPRPFWMFHYFVKLLTCSYSCGSMCFVFGIIISCRTYLMQRQVVRLSLLWPSLTKTTTVVGRFISAGYYWWLSFIWLWECARRVVLLHPCHLWLCLENAHPCHHSSLVVVSSVASCGVCWDAQMTAQRILPIFGVRPPGVVLDSTSFVMERRVDFGSVCCSLDCPAAAPAVDAAFVFVEQFWTEWCI